jgi:hypothetical protein
MASVLLCVGCSETKLDTSSDKAFSESLEKVYNTVPEAEREDFRDYLGIVVDGRYHPYVVAFGKIAERSTPSYEQIIKAYSLIKASGKEDGIAALNKLNGLTKTDIISQGKTITQKAIEERLPDINQQIDALSKETEPLKKYNEELAKISIELGPVEALESKNRKGRIGELSVTVTITNGSSKKMTGFNNAQYGDAITFTDANGKKADGRVAVSMSSFKLEDGSWPFSQGMYSDNKGLDAGKSITGKITSGVSSSTPFPYPPENEFTAALVDGMVQPVLEDEDLIRSSRESMQTLELRMEEKKLLEADLAKAAAK